MKKSTKLKQTPDEAFTADLRSLIDRHNRTGTFCILFETEELDAEHNRRWQSIHRGASSTLQLMLAWDLARTGAYHERQLAEQMRKSNA